MPRWERIALIAAVVVIVLGGAAWYWEREAAPAWTTPFQAVLLDSGVRGGADVLKALALGASAVCLGRPYVYGLAVAGERGVREVIANILAELDLTLGLAGCTAVRKLSSEMLSGPGPQR